MVPCKNIAAKVSWSTRQLRLSYIHMYSTSTRNNYMIYQMYFRYVYPCNFKSTNHCPFPHVVGR